MRLPSPRALTFLLVVFAFLIRALHCQEGLPYLHDWDEPQTASTALIMMRSGDFDPHFFNYGSLMIYIDLVVDSAHALSLLGARESPGQSLEAVGNIVVGQDTGWWWTISHPSFYLWDRLVVAGMGAGTVALVAAIGRRMFGAWTALAGAALLAGLPVHVLESARVANDAPVAFFVLLAVYCAACFLEELRPGWLIGALVACGLATSCKYNAGMSLLVPVAAMVQARAGRRTELHPWLWPALLVVPALSFLLTTPYALLDLPTFLNHAGYELRHYKVLGHGGATVEPGWDNLAIQAGEAWRNLGLIPTALCLAGLPLVGRRWQGWTLLLLFPLCYGAYMVNTRISFHRNFLVIYPFLCLGCTATVHALVPLAPRAVRVLPALGLVWLGLAVPPALRAWEPETRSKIVDDLRAGSWTRIGIPEELRLHAIDLARLRARDVLVAPLEELLCRSDREVVVVPVSFASATDPLAAWRLNTLLPPLEAVLLHGAAGRGEYLLDEPSINPQLRIVRPSPPRGACDASVVEPGDLIHSEAAGQAAGGLRLWGNAHVESPPHAQASGEWALRWILSGTPAGGVAPRVHLEVRSPSGTLASADADLKPEPQPVELPFELEADAEVVFSLDYGNDAIVGQEDRDVLVGGLTLTRR